MSAFGGGGAFSFGNSNNNANTQSTFGNSGGFGSNNNTTSGKSQHFLSFLRLFQLRLLCVYQALALVRQLSVQATITPLPSGQITRLEPPLEVCSNRLSTLYSSVRFERLIVTWEKSDIKPPQPVTLLQLYLACCDVIFYI